MQDTGKKIFTDICEGNVIFKTLQPSNIEEYDCTQAFVEKNATQRLLASVHVLLNQIEGTQEPVEINRVSIDYYISKIDTLLSDQINAILHHEDFQALEASWRSLEYLVDHQVPTSNCKIDILDVTKEELQDNFSDSLDSSQTVLHQHIFTDEYDMPGGEPYAAMVGDYKFAPVNSDITLLKNIAGIASIAHCPMIGSIGSEFFQKNNYQDLDSIEDMEAYFDRAEYTAWHAFRETEESRYIGLAMPGFKLRLPYGTDLPCKKFGFLEAIRDDRAYLWGHASFAFASNMLKSFNEHGWAVNIRGSESGGKITELPLESYGCGLETFSRPPVECLISEAKEVVLSNLGFIPLCYYKNTDYACFFSANSIQKVKSYYDAETQANVRINARLPYVFLVSRIGHYLKVLQRENIGASKTPRALEMELNRWLAHLVTKMPNPDAELIAKHPLREGYVEVSPNPDNPGFLKVNLFVKPHFQIEGVDVKLSLVAELPGQTEGKE